MLNLPKADGGGTEIGPIPPPHPSFVCLAVGGEEGVEVDGAVSVDDLEAAIHEASRDNVEFGIPLLLFLAGHGGKEVFFIGDDDELYAQELKGWLDGLVTDKVEFRQLAGPEEAPPEEVVLVVDFCYSRTFLERLKGPGRIIIGSSSREVASVIEGESFGSFFFDGVSRGWDVWRSFEEALVRVKSVFDQTPYLDADGDGLPVYDEKGRRNPQTESDRRIAESVYIGGEFINVFEEEANKIGGADFLAQGTLYPDVIESVSFTGGPSVTIKSHHNVGGLPERMSMELVEPALCKVIHAAYRLLGLISFFTTGNEVRAWPVREGSTAPEAAGRIHTDFEQGFIRVEVYSVDDLRACRSEPEIRAAGKMRVEGKSYVVQDGDVCHFLFHA